MKRLYALSVLFFLLTWQFSLAQIPPTISYQGVLVNATGSPVADGNYNLTFKLYEAAAGGAPLWSETQSVVVISGIFNVILGSASPLNPAFDKLYWLGVTVATEPELAPRLQLTASAYSLNARSIADSAVTRAKIARGQVVKSINGLKDDVALIPGSNVTINSSGNGLTISASASGGGLTLPFSGSVAAASPTFSTSNTGTGAGLSGTSRVGPGVTAFSDSGIAVYGQSNTGSAATFAIANTASSADALVGFTYGNGRSVYGYNYGNGVAGDFRQENQNATADALFTETKGKGNAVHAYNIGTSNAGLFETQNTNNSAAALSATTIGAGSAGDFRINNASSPASALYVATNGSGTGVYGESATGNGVSGVVTSTTAFARFGVYGEARGNSSFGVFGYNNATGAQSQGGLGDANTGAFGYSISGTGLKGTSIDGYGISGFGGNIGVYAHNTMVNGNDAYLGANCCAADLYGNVAIHGTLSKSAGSFKIDHPLDPANKYLSHSFVESPDMMNIYNGNATLDANGAAVVELPPWFEALNGDFRYQLTSLGAPGPNLYVAQEISGNRFKIAGGAPGGKVSWQVTGIRRDAYANAHRILVEEEKPAAERGYYIHPELYGQPGDKNVQHVLHPETELLLKDATTPVKTAAQKGDNQ